MGWTRILKRVMETWGDSNSRVKPSANAGVKNSQEVKIITMIQQHSKKAPPPQSMMWEIFTAQIREENYNSLISRKLFPEQQKKCRKGTRETGELLYINERKARRKNPSMGWIDYKTYGEKETYKYLGILEWQQISCLQNSSQYSSRS